MYVILLLKLDEFYVFVMVIILLIHKKNAFKTPGCFHHYKSEEIDLYYEFGHLQDHLIISFSAILINKN